MAFFKRLRLQRWEQHALRHLGAGRYEQAEQYFRLIYDAVPEGEGVRYNMGLACFAQGKHDEAEGYFREELKRFGETTHTLKALSELAYQTGRRDAARKYLTKLLRHVEGAEYALIARRLTIVEDDERFEKAVRAQQAVSDAENALLRSDLDTALAEYRRAAELDDTQFTARAGLGKILYEFYQELPEALRWYREAYELAPDPRYEQQIERIEKALDRAKGAGRKSRR